MRFAPDPPRVGDGEFFDERDAKEAAAIAAAQADDVCSRLYADGMALMKKRVQDHAKAATDRDAKATEGVPFHPTVTELANGLKGRYESFDYFVKDKLAWRKQRDMIFAADPPEKGGLPLSR